MKVPTSTGLSFLLIRIWSAYWQKSPRDDRRIQASLREFKRWRRLRYRASFLRRSKSRLRRVRRIISRYPEITRRFQAKPQVLIEGCVRIAALRATKTSFSFWVYLFLITIPVAVVMSLTDRAEKVGRSVTPFNEVLAGFLVSMIV